MVTTRSADKRKDASDNLALRSRKLDGDTPSATPTQSKKRNVDVSTPASTRSKRLKTTKTTLPDIATPKPQNSDSPAPELSATEPTDTQTGLDNVTSTSSKPAVQVIVPPAPSTTTSTRAMETPGHEVFQTPATSKHKRFDDNDDAGSEADADDTIVVNQEPEYETANEGLDESDDAPEVETVSKASAKGRKRRPKAADFLDEVVEKVDDATENIEEEEGAVAEGGAKDDITNNVSTAAARVPSPSRVPVGPTSSELTRDPERPRTPEPQGVDHELSPEPASAETARDSRSSPVLEVDEEDTVMVSEAVKLSATMEDTNAKTTEAPPEPAIAIDTAPPRLDVEDFSTNADFMPLMTIPEVAQEDESMGQAAIEIAEADRLAKKRKAKELLAGRLKQNHLPDTARSSLSKFRADKMRGRRNLESTWKGKRSTFVTS